MSKNQFISANQQEEKQIISSTGWTLPSAYSADSYGLHIENIRIREIIIYFIFFKLN